MKRDLPAADRRGRARRVRGVVLGLGLGLGLGLVFGFHSLGVLSVASVVAGPRAEDTLTTLLLELPADPRAGLGILTEGGWSRRAGAGLTAEERRQVPAAFTAVPNEVLMGELALIAGDPAAAHLALAVQPLIPLLEDERVEVVKATWNALKRITGEKIAPEADAWRRRLPA